MPPTAKARRGELGQFWRTFRRNQLACVGAVVVGVLVVVAAFALAWHGAPVGTRSLALIVDDPDASIDSNGMPATTLFTNGAHRLIYRYSGGVPRLINVQTEYTIATLPGAGDEQLLSAEQVGCATAEQQEATVAEHVARDDPLQLGGREVQVGLDGGQRDADHRDVEPIEEEHAAQDDEQDGGGGEAGEHAERIHADA